MPFIDRKIESVGAPAVAEFDTPDPAFLDTLGAAYRQENIIGSALAKVGTNLDAMGATGRNMNAIDPSYNVYQDPDMKAYLDEDPEIGVDIFNKTAADARRAQIDMERKDRATLDASGWTGFGLSMVAGITDPTILVPGGALARSGRIGYSAARSAAAVGVAAGVGAAAQEAGLQTTQEERSADQTALAIGGSVILGGLIGGAAGSLFSKGEWDRVSRQLEADLADDVPNPDEVTQTIVGRLQSAGAAAVEQVDLSDLGIGGGRAAELVARATAAAQINPGVRTMFSPSVKVREVYGKLVDNPIYTTMNMEGRSLGPAVENLVKLYDRGALADWIKTNNDLYLQYRKSLGQGAVSARLPARGAVMTRHQFNEAVARAGRRGDVDLNGNEFVTRAAQEARAKVFDPLLERAKAAGLLPEDVKVTTAASYVTRMWNVQKLIGEEDRFRSIARRYFTEQLSRMPEAERPDFVSAADMRDYVEEVITSVFNNLTGRNRSDMPEWMVPVTRGPLKERTFNIPDELVEDFLENDMEAILRRYARTMAAEVELTDKFGRADMRDQIAEINREYDELSAAAKTPEERIKLDARRRQDLTNLEAFRDMIRGTYRASDEASNWSKITRAALTWNYMRLLGGVALSSVTDAARIVGVHGVRATMKEALPGLVKGVKAAKISRADAKALGAVTERVMQSRLASLAELNNPYAYGSRFERFLSNTSSAFTKATGLGYWNDMMKSVASVMTQNRMMRNALDWSKAEKSERAYMAMLGIDEDMAERIAAQFKRHGIEEDGIYGANVSMWDDDLAKRAWAAALNKDVDRTIITKSVADTPLWMKTNWGKLIMQFKSFGLASHQRVLIAGLQERPHRLAEQMVFATSIGMLIAYLKFVERGDFDRAEQLLENPGKWVADGLDRSGILSIPFEISNTIDKVSEGAGGPNVGISRAFSVLAGDSDASGSVSRYASRGSIGAVAGPSLGIFEDLATIAGQLGQGNLKRSGANAMIRQIPGATLPGFRSAIHVGIKPALMDAVE